MEEITEEGLKLRTGEGLATRDALLKGELQGVAVRRLISNSSKESYPSEKEIFYTFFLPKDIQRLVGEITYDTLRVDGKEREVFIAFGEGNFEASQVLKGTEHVVNIKKKDLFPKNSGIVLMDIHTHPGDFFNLPSTVDLANFITYARHIPVMVVSGSTGGWLLLKTAEFFKTNIPQDSKSLYKELKRDLDNAEKRFMRKNSRYTFEDFESFQASFLEKYGIMFFKSEAYISGCGTIGRRPILDEIPEQRFEHILPKYREVTPEVA